MTIRKTVGKDTGIFVTPDRETYTGKDVLPAVRRLAKDHRKQWDIGAFLRVVEENLHDVLQSHGRKPYTSRRQNDPPHIQDALRAMDFVRGVRDTMKAGMFNKAVRLAFELGVVYTRLQVRPFESLAISGDGVRRRMKRGSDIWSQLANASHRAIRAAYEKRRREHPKDSQRYAMERVAEETKKSVSTVKRAPKKNMKKVGSNQYGLNP